MDNFPARRKFSDKLKFASGGEFPFSATTSAPHLPLSLFWVTAASLSGLILSFFLLFSFLFSLFFLSSLPIFPRKKLKLEFSCDVTSVCVVNNTLESPRKVSPCIYDELFGPSFMRRRRSFTRSVFTLRSTHCLWLYMAHNCTDRTVCRPVYRATVSS